MHTLGLARDFGSACTSDIENGSPSSELSFFDLQIVDAPGNEHVQSVLKSLCYVVLDVSLYVYP